jgi:glycerophosphoryl diester phosphodiesterase
MGIYETSENYWIWVQHELLATRNTDFSKTVSGQFTGARISLFKLTKDWEVVGGMPLIRDAKSRVFGDARTVSISSDLTSMTQGGSRGFGRFCSGYLATSGFVDANGTEVPVWFAAEEDETLDFGGSHGSFAWACFPSGKAYAIEGLGAFSKEQAYPASQYRATNNSQTVIFGTEDSRDGEIYMWVGNQTEADPNGFLSGNLYVMQVLDGSNAHMLDANTMTVGASYTANWTLVDSIDLRDSDGDGIYTDEHTSQDPAGAINVASTTTYSVGAGDYRGFGPGAGDTLTGSQAAQAALDAFVDAEGTNRRNSSVLYGANSTNFDRPEDWHEDPNTPGTFYFAATEGEVGGTAGDALTSNTASPSVLYRFVLNASNPALPGTITVVAQGGGIADLTTPGYTGPASVGSGIRGNGMSYDNLVVDSFGNVILQEDASGSLATPVMRGEFRYARILSMNPSDPTNPTALFDCDILSIVGKLDNSTSAFFDADGSGSIEDSEKIAANLVNGVWETSGVEEITSLNKFGRPALLFNVQAHRLRNEAFLNGAHREGGQILVAIPNGVDVPQAIAQRERMLKPVTVGHHLGLTDIPLEWVSMKKD